VRHERGTGIIAEEAIGRVILLPAAKIDLGGTSGTLVVVEAGAAMLASGDPEARTSLGLGPTLPAGKAVVPPKGGAIHPRNADGVPLVLAVLMVRLAGRPTLQQRDPRGGRRVMAVSD
jgi:hypothetical protein